MEEFSMREIINNDVIPAYMHDGSENFIDEIELKISDGKFEQREKMASSSYFYFIVVSLNKHLALTDSFFNYKDFLLFKNA